MTTKKVAVTGATGLIGTALCAALVGQGHEVRRVTRAKPIGTDIGWDPAAGTIDTEALGGVDAVVHLAGAGIGDKRWTAEYKRVIRDSRVDGTDLMARTLAGLDPKPAVFLSGSAVGFYGDTGDEVHDESSPPGDGFLAEVCHEWEAAAAPAADAGIRTAFLRTGIVLSHLGGALRKQLPLFRLGLGGKLGSGKQFLSWISVVDEVAAIIHLLDSPVRGPVNLTAPNPVPQKEFAQTLARVLKRPAFLPIPKFGPKLLLGSEAANDLLFIGQRAIPTVLEGDGFQFAHPDLESALRSLLT